MKRKKGVPEKIRPFAGDKEIAQKIADMTGLDVIDVLSLALSAGLHAIADNNYKFQMPLTLSVSEPKPGSAGKYPGPRDVDQQIRIEDKPGSGVTSVRKRSKP